MILTSLAFLFLLIALIYFMGGVRALFKKDLMGLTSRLSMSTVCFALSLTLFLGFVVLRGYHTFTYEKLAATIHIEPIESGLFYAHFEYPDGEKKSYKIYGEELYVDAQILKWKPFANFIGIHTSYLLARVGGRYYTVMDELNKQRSIFPLSKENELDLFNLRRRFSELSFLVDAEYGSATFVPVKDAYYALNVSTSGLLFREIPKP